MDFNSALEKLKDSNIFKKWKKENPKCYIIHGFIMLDPEMDDEWQIGYYNADNERITTFVRRIDLVRRGKYGKG